MKEYEERAVSLALNRAKLQALTSKLKAVRMTCPLFDTARWVSGDYIDSIIYMVFSFSVRFFKLILNLTGEES